MDRFERLAGALRRIPGLEVRENEPMKRHTTFRIGGPARLMALPRSRKEAAAAVQALSCVQEQIIPRSAPADKARAPAGGPFPERTGPGSQNFDCL